MKENKIDNIVSALSKKKWKIISQNDIISILESIYSEGTLTDNIVYKCIHTLKNKGYILWVRKNMFFIHPIPSKPTHEQIITDTYYRSLLKKTCTESCGDAWYIWWRKAFEIHLWQFDIPDTIDIINEKKSWTETIMFDHACMYKSYTARMWSCFNLYKKFTKPYKINKYVFRLAWPELSIIESLHNPSSIHRLYIYELVKKYIRKHKKTLDIQCIERIVQIGKYHVSLNRLHTLACTIDENLAERLYACIKKCSFVMKKSI